MLLFRFFINRYRSELTGVLLLLTYLGMALYTLSDYLLTDLNAYLGLALLPYVLIVRQEDVYSNRYLWGGLGLLCLSLLIPAKMLYYFSLVCALLLLAENVLGRINYLPLFMLGVISPVFKYLGNVFSIPVRLKMSEVAASVLSLANFDVKAAGNVIVMNGAEFSVDPTCMGLNMMATSFVLGIFLLAFYERKTKKQLSFFFTCMAMGIVLLLNVVCNFLRILFIVLFQLMPESPGHELAGLLCLTLYVIAPLFLIFKLIYRFAPTTPAQNKPTTSLPFGMRLTGQLVVVAGICWKGLTLSVQPETAQVDFSLPGYQKEVLSSGVVKFAHEQALIYVKPSVGFYGADHNPMVCWTGSGYEFKNIQKLSLAGEEIYAGTLHKGNDLLYTAWWFDNGHYRTISQWDWRGRMVQGEAPFYLVNVSAETEEGLKKEIKRLMGSGFLSEIHH